MWLSAPIMHVIRGIILIVLALVTVTLGVAGVSSVLGRPVRWSTMCCHQDEGPQHMLTLRMDAGAIVLEHESRSEYSVAAEEGLVALLNDHRRRALAGSSGGTNIDFAGFRYAREDRVGLKSLVVRYHGECNLVRTAVRTAAAPIWTVLVVTGLYPASCPFFAGVRRYRRRRGLCVTCGYNLTGNESGVCSECGARCEGQMR